MLNWLTRRSVHNRIAGDIYGSIVASARQQTFFDAWGVPDTREGRFEMLALHMALVMHRLAKVGAPGVALSRTLAEVFITDLDDNMREIGIGDIVVPKKIKRAAAALYDRHRDYAAALAPGAGPDALAAQIGSAFGGGDAAIAIPGLDKQTLSHYVQRLSSALAATSDADCLAGKLPLPWPPV